jgi:endonuclease YncB( thermonuclease family)
MSKRVRGRKAAAGKVKQDTRNAIVGAILFACLVALYVYTRWNTEPQTPITGKAWVIDGDTIVISDTHIRLEGIDAPESDQSCTDAQGKPWPCGRTAASELRAHISGQELTCQPRALDKYKRVLAVCTLSDGSDVNAWLVQQGWAIAFGYAGTYEAEEAQAKSASRGIWAGTFQSPSQWRQDHKE